MISPGKCIAYLGNGNICGAPAYFVNAQIGGLVCSDHAGPIPVDLRGHGRLPECPSTGDSGKRLHARPAGSAHAGEPSSCSGPHVAAGGKGRETRR